MLALSHVAGYRPSMVMSFWKTGSLHDGGISDGRGKDGRKIPHLTHVCGRLQTVYHHTNPVRAAAGVGNLQRAGIALSEALGKDPVAAAAKTEEQNKRIDD